MDPWCYYLKFHMEKEVQEQWALSTQQRRLFNILEIRMYDILQNAQLLGKQLTNNQVLDNMAHAHQLCNQLRPIFEQLRAVPLYNMLMKVHTNSLMLTNLMVNRAPGQKIAPTTQRSDRSSVIESDKKPKEDPSLEGKKGKKDKKQGSARMGGVHLYNQDYRRGVQFTRCTCEAGKTDPERTREAFLKEVARQLQNQTDVQVNNINDEVQIHINNYKGRRQEFTSIDYEKEFGDIIDFFKVSEKEAMSFLHKTPKTAKIAEELGTTIEEIERQIREREKNERSALQQRLKQFLLKLKGQIAHQKALTVQKEAQLEAYKKSLMKESRTYGIQTSDDYHKTVKELQQVIRTHEERYEILTQVQKKELQFEDKYHQVNHTLEIRNKEVQKLKDQIGHLTQEVEQSKKMMKELKQKAQSHPEGRKRIIEVVNKSQKNEQVVPQQEQAEQEFNENDYRDSRIERRPRRTDKLVTRSSSMYRASFDAQQATAGLAETILSVNEPPETPRHNVSKLSKFASRNTSVIQGDKDMLKSGESKKAKKSTKDEDQKQVKFGDELQKRTSLEKLPLEQDPAGAQSPRNRFRSRTSIDNEGEWREDVYTSRKSSKKNTLRQKIESNGMMASQREIDAFENKYSSKNISTKGVGSKKGIFLKEQKDRNVMAVQIKRVVLTKEQVYEINMVLKAPPEAKKSQVRMQRGSYPSQNDADNTLESINKRFNGKDGLKRQNRRPHQNNSNTSQSSKGGLSDMARANRGNSLKNKLRIAKPHFAEAELESSKEVSFRDTVDMFKSIGNQQSRKLLKESKHKSYKEMMESLEGNQRGKQPMKQNMSSKNLKKLIEYLADRNSEDSSKGEEGLITVKSKAKIRAEMGEENGQLADYLKGQLEKGKIDLEELKEVENILKISEKPLEANHNETKKKNWRTRESREFGAQVEQRFMTDKQIVGQDCDAIEEQDEQEDYLKKRDTLGYLSHKAIFPPNRSTSPTKQLLEISMTEPNTQTPPEHKEYPLQLNISAFERLAQLHHSKGKCRPTAPGELCQHLRKYLAIIERVNHMGDGNKASLHLPVETIGDAQYWHLNKDLAATVGTGWSTGNSREPTQQRRNNILPLITTTTSSGYYRPKHKQVK